MAVDIGGTRVRAARVSSEGRILRRLREPVRDPHDGQALTDQVLALVRRLGEPPEAREPGRAGDEAGAAAGAGANAEADGSSQAPVAVGLSVPAVLDRSTGRVEWAPNLPGWNGWALGPRLSDSLGLPVTLEYDGHAAALGEQWTGAGRLVPDLAFIIVGTGVGGGIISGGRLVRGATNLAGAGGWMGVPASGGWDAGAAAERGFLESLISGPALAARARWLLNRPVDARELFERAREGDVACREIVGEAVEHLAWALVGVVSLLNPRLVLLGGSVGLQLAQYGPQIEATIRRYAQPWAARAVQVAPASLGDDAGLLGAARSALELAPPGPGERKGDWDGS